MSLLLPKHYNENKSIHTLIENRTTYSSSYSELNVFETSEYVKEVRLTFNSPVIASMIKGEKLMKVKDYDAFRFTPGESIIMPSHEEMIIEFPNASLEQPTQCTALTIEEAKMNAIIHQLNEQRHQNNKETYDTEWKNLHFSNSNAFQQITNKLLFLFMENNPSKDFFIDLTLQELIVRLLQTRQLKHLKQENLLASSNSKLRDAIHYITNNLSEQFDAEELSRKACMSVSHFYKTFKDEYGISPTEFINEKKIDLAAKMIRNNPKIQLKEIYDACGFRNYSYFYRTFKKIKKLSPSEYQNRSNNNMF